MIWGDRLLDGTTTGLGMWEASMNNTARAVDMISKDVFICDWHYDEPALTPIYFALKGFDVAICPWNKPAVGVRETEDMIRFREQANKTTKPHLRGVIHTVWTGLDQFLRNYYDPETYNKEVSDAVTLKRLMEEFAKL